MGCKRCLICERSYDESIAKELGFIGYCSRKCRPKRIILRKKNEPSITEHSVIEEWSKAIALNRSKRMKWASKQLSKKQKKKLRKQKKHLKHNEDLRRAAEARKKKGEYRLKSQEFLNSDEWKKLRYVALRKYGGRCQLCSRDRNSGVVIHVDHIKPRYHYPELSLDINNLQVLCEDCNVGKGARFEDDWRPAQK